MSDRMREGRDFRETDHQSHLGSQHSDSASNATNQVQQQIRLTPDEQRVLRECNHESFYYRCLPLGIVFIGGTQLLVSRGFLKPNPRFGALFKNLGAGLAAFLLGKISYQGRCREKIMSLENSPLAESMRSGKRGPELMQDILSFPSSSSSDAPDSKIVKDEGIRKDDHRRSDFSGDGKTYEYKGLDDNKRPSLDRERSLYSKSKADDPVKQVISYDDLRSQNRKDYERKMNSSQPSSSKTSVEPSYTTKTAEETHSGFDSDRPASSSKGLKRNQYGDLVET